MAVPLRATGTAFCEADPMESPEQVVSEFIRRITGNDVVGALTMVSDDVEYDNVPIGKNIGPAAMQEFLNGMGTGVDEIEFVIHHQVTQGRIVMNARTDRFRIGERWLDLPVAGVFEVGGDGRITLWRDYFDMATFTDQLTDILGG